jgi:hydrogenase maturation protease
MPASISRVLVLGLGNDILTDDAVGLRVVEAARAFLAGEPDIEVRITTEMGLALLDEIADRESIVLVDSVQTGEAPIGTIHEIDSMELTRVLTTAPHFLGIGETLALGRMLGLAMPRDAMIFAIEVADPYTLGTVMTPAVEQAVAQAAGRVAAQARQFARASFARVEGGPPCPPEHGADILPGRT